MTKVRNHILSLKLSSYVVLGRHGPILLFHDLPGYLRRVSGGANRRWSNLCSESVWLPHRSRHYDRRERHWYFSLRWFGAVHDHLGDWRCCCLARNFTCQWHALCENNSTYQGLSSHCRTDNDLQIYGTYCGDFFTEGPEQCDGGVDCKADCTCPTGQISDTRSGCANGKCSSWSIFLFALIELKSAAPVAVPRSPLASVTPVSLPTDDTSGAAQLRWNLRWNELVVCIVLVIYWWVFFTFFPVLFCTNTASKAVLKFFYTTYAI